MEEYRVMYDEIVKEKKEKLQKEHEDYLQRRKEQGAGEPIVMNQVRTVILSFQSYSFSLRALKFILHQVVQSHDHSPDVRGLRPASELRFVSMVTVLEKMAESLC